MGSNSLQICRFSLAFIWVYQGIVPKWLGPHPDELAMNIALGLPAEHAVWLSYVGGSMEVVLGLAILFFYRKRWPFTVSALAISGLYLFTVLMTRQYLVSAFNSTTANLAIFALSCVALSQLSAEAEPCLSASNDGGVSHES